MCVFGDKYQDVVLLNHMVILFLFIIRSSYYFPYSLTRCIHTNCVWEFLFTTTWPIQDISRHFDMCHFHRYKIIYRYVSLHFPNHNWQRVIFFKYLLVIPCFYWDVSHLLLLNIYHKCYVKVLTPGALSNWIIPDITS